MCTIVVLNNGAEITFYGKTQAEKVKAYERKFKQIGIKRIIQREIPSPDGKKEDNTN